MSTICDIFILLIKTIIPCSTTENQRIFSVCFKSNFASAISIPIVHPQIAIQADNIFLGDVAVFICFISDIDSPACIGFQIIGLLLKGAKYRTAGDKLAIFISNFTGTDSRTPGILVSRYIRRISSCLTICFIL